MIPRFEYRGSLLEFKDNETGYAPCVSANTLCMTARPERLIWPQNGEDCIFAATLEHETKVSLKTRELDLHHRLAMSAMMRIRLSFWRSGVERGAAKV
jgi:hypothetical protein